MRPLGRSLRRAATWLGRPAGRRRLALGYLRACAALTVAVLLGAGTLVVHSWTLPLPAVLLRAEPAGLRISDRNGQLLARLRGGGDAWREHLELGDLGPHTLDVLVAAEDGRFWSHPGVDPLAMGRAALQALTQGRIVSGASTITQQLARSCFARPRNLWGKLQEISLALRIERSLSKQQILLSYLNRVDFGPRVSGMAAASDRYLGKPIGALDLGETALLMATVRGPSVYDLERHLGRARERRDVILKRAAARGLVPERDVTLALATPAVLRPRSPWSGAWHLTRRIARQQPKSAEVVSTVDLNLERRIEELARRRQHELAESGVGAVAVVVLDTKTADVLAYVGSHDSKSARELGQNDGVASLRQPGSALKPLLYAAAVDELGMDGESILPDEPLTFRTPLGHYTPDNYDRRFRGPVTLSRALASSLNVPAVFVLERLGVARGLSTLREFGLNSLGRDAQHYGLGLALGGGEVSLLELTAAYSVLGRGGLYRSPRLTMEQKQAPERPVVSPHAARLITEILRDAPARSEMFGRSALEASEGLGSFALKTGTSSGFRDAWALVYDERVTVGVWVGNFDGRPMVRTSGALGAAPLAVEIWSEACAVAVTSVSGLHASPVGLPESSGSGTFAWIPPPRITFPVDGARLSSRSPEGRAEIVVRASHPPSGARLLVDGRTVEWTGGRAVITAEIGVHDARLLDARGEELSRVTFRVVKPG